MRYILVICSLALLGIAARYFHLNNEKPKVYTPEGIEVMEQNHE